ncbi:toxin-antitoxin system TumE family protein [Endothiovibrio diazotrophicus]
MDARLITRRKEILSETERVEMVIWEVPAPVDPSEHLIKYRLVYIVAGERIVGYDNERGKGDHCHLDGEERPYVFTSIEALVEDFLSEVAKRRAP